MKHLSFSLLLTAVLFYPASSLLAGTPPGGVEFSSPLDLLTLQNGKSLLLDVGIGSGACRLASEADGVFYTITDRGPNIKTKDSLKLLGVDASDKKGKIFPTPNFAPSIFQLHFKDGQLSVLSKIQIKTRSGIPVSGISNADTEAVWDINNKAISYDPNGLDPEGIAKLQDGSFWVGEEYGPSILHIASDGRILQRWVPKGVKSSLNGADYEVVEKLPAILRKRPLNRGIESITVSPDEKYLYFALQSPLANPNKGAYKKSRNVRIFKIDRIAGTIIGEFVYTIDTPKSFLGDNKTKKRAQHDIKVSELTAVGQDKLVVLERISKTTKFYLVDLSGAQNILGSPWDSITTSPTLEQTTDITLQPLSKKLLLNSDDRGGIMKKIEGLAWMGGNQWIMVNDNDFGIGGDPTFIVPVEMAVE